MRSLNRIPCEAGSECLGCQGPRGQQAGSECGIADHSLEVMPGLLSETQEGAGVLKERGLKVDTKERWVMLSVALVAGLMGGMVSGRFLVEPVTAKETTNQSKVIVAEEFRLVDREGMSPPGPWPLEKPHDP